MIDNFSCLHEFITGTRHTSIILSLDATLELYLYMAVAEAADPSTVDRVDVHGNVPPPNILGLFYPVTVG